jgi:hypothetical protein
MLVPDPETHVYSMVIDQKWDLSFYQRMKTLYLSTPCGEALSPENKEVGTLMMKLLRFNLKRLANTDELLSLNEDGTALVLRKALPIGEIAEHRVVEHFEDFLSTVEAWHKLFFGEPGGIPPKDAILSMAIRL